MSETTGTHGGATVTSDIGPYTMVPAWLMYAEHSDGTAISDRAVRLFAVIGRCIGDDGTGTIYRSTLAKKMDCSKASVDRARDELIALGALNVAKRKIEGKKENAASRYTLRFAKPQNARLMVAAQVRTPLVTGEDQVSSGVSTGGLTGEEEEENFSYTETPNDLMTEECEKCNGTTWVPDLVGDPRDVLPCPDCHPDGNLIDPSRYETPDAPPADESIAEAKVKAHGGVA